jgi:hypothetical protein
MDTGKYTANTESEGAPTWILNGHKEHTESEGAPTRTLVSTRHILKVREHLQGHW